MTRPHQKWTITAAPDSSGYLGGPYYKIAIAGTNRALAATADAEVITIPEFTGAPEQLWLVDADGFGLRISLRYPDRQGAVSAADIEDPTCTFPTLHMVEYQLQHPGLDVPTPRREHVPRIREVEKAQEEEDGNCSQQGKQKGQASKDEAQDTWHKDESCGNPVSIVSFPSGGLSHGLLSPIMSAEAVLGQGRQVDWALCCSA